MVSLAAEPAAAPAGGVDVAARAAGCEPEPDTNLAGLDLVGGTANHLRVLDTPGQRIWFVDGVGPADDQRASIRPVETYLNFGITDHYLGAPCNPPRTVKVCVDFYDDPAFAGAGVRFGPEAYATDAVDGVAYYPAERRHVLTGSGRWIRRSWIVGGVNLRGINADSYTAGPRFVSENGAVAVSRFEIAVLRTGDHPLAGQDPLAGCFEDPNVCVAGAYGNFVELDLGRNLRHGLDVGSSGGDQMMIVEEAGPATDRRLAVRPAHDNGTPTFEHGYLNFAILNEALGPSSQPPARLAICVTYYDDPNLAGTRFKPEAYVTERDGTLALAFPADSFLVTLEGSDGWRDAYWEIPDVKFVGVSQGPQAAARFLTVDAGDVQAKIAVTRVRYAVIAPCGPLEGVNLLEPCNPAGNVALRLRREGPQLECSWPVAAGGFGLEETSGLSPARWTLVGAAPEVVGDRWVVSLPVQGRARFFRLAR